MIYITHDQQETLDKLKSGDITDLRSTAKWPADAIALHALNEGFLKQGLCSFPDPRNNWSVPIDAILLSQILRSLNDEHSFLNAPYMLNNAELITKLGYNIKALDEGFNDQNIYPRTTPFDGDTLKHILLQMKAPSLVSWFNEKWEPLWKEFAPGRTHQYILDGMDIPIPAHLKDKFQGCGCVKDDEGNITYGYKTVFLYEIVDCKGIIVALKIGPINTHDIVLGKELVNEFNFEKESMLIMDRGFIDGPWIKDLKLNKQIDICLPLRRNMELTQAARAQADNRGDWQGHPTRKNQVVYELTKPDLYWKDCDVFESGVLVRRWQKDGEPNEVLFVTTKYKVSGKRLLEIYDQRAEIEEAHRQMKVFQGVESLLSKNYVNVVFRIIIAVLGYNLFNLFLNSEDSKDFAEYSMKTLRQKKVPDKNPEIIIYSEGTYTTMKLFSLMRLLMDLKKNVRNKLDKLFYQLELSAQAP